MNESSVLYYLSTSPTTDDPTAVDFQPTSVSEEQDIADVICSSVWSPAVYRGNKRKDENVIRIDFLVYDIDDGTTIEQARAALDQNQLAYIIGLTKSHNKQKGNKPPCDRFRVIIPFAKPLTAFDRPQFVDLYKRVYEFVAKSLGITVDHSCKNPSRLYFPCTLVKYTQNGSPISFEATVAKIEAQQPTVVKPQQTIFVTPEQTKTLRPGDADRIRKWLSKLPPAVSGDHGDQQTYKVSAFLINDCGLSQSDAIAFLREYNARCTPPWDDNDLLRFLNNAGKYATAEYGSFWQRPNNNERRSIYDSWSLNELRDQCVPILDQFFKTFSESNGSIRIFSVGDKKQVVWVTDELALERVLYKSLVEQFDDVPSQAVLHRAIDIWKKETKPLPSEPEPFCFQDEDVYTFKRLDFNVTQGLHPSWDEFLDRLSDAEAFKAFVWSAFDKQNKGRQYLWLRGEGQDGKSCVLKVIDRCFGKASASLTQQLIGSDNRFVGSALYGKRVAMFADCKNAKVGMTGILRNVVSGDPIAIEAKGRDAFNAVVHVKLFIASNYKPEITSQQADTSRLIWIEVASSKNTDDPAWEERLYHELPYFLYSCREAYARVCQKQGQITLSSASIELLQDAVHSIEEEFQIAFDDLFEVDDNSVMRGREFRERLVRFDAKKIGEFKRWLERKYGVTASRDTAGVVYKRLRAKFDAPGLRQTIKR